MALAKLAFRKLVSVPDIPFLSRRARRKFQSSLSKAFITSSFKSTCWSPDWAAWWSISPRSTSECWIFLPGKNANCWGKMIDSDRTISELPFELYVHPFENQCSTIVVSRGGLHFHTAGGFLDWSIDLNEREQGHTVSRFVKVQRRQSIAIQGGYAPYGSRGFPRLFRVSEASLLTIKEVSILAKLGISPEIPKCTPMERGILVSNDSNQFPK